MTEADGNTVVAEALASQGVKYAFGIVGFPVIELGMALQGAGIHYIACRNEQAAAYAAGAIGYITGMPAVCLTVCGPGMIHALGGMANANENCWPMLVVSGASIERQDAMGAFQEFPQVEAARLYSKFSGRPSSIPLIPHFVEKAVRTSMVGRPGATYIDLPPDVLQAKVPAESVKQVPRAPEPAHSLADPDSVRQAVQELLKAQRPLVVVGKGVAYGKAEKEVLALVMSLKMPFLPTPMGKGTIPDDHPFNVNPARSRALLQADCILLLGARLNWILHFGSPPRFSADVKVIQVEICPEEMHNNVRSYAVLQGHVRPVLRQITAEVLASAYTGFRSDAPWWKNLHDNMESNLRVVQRMTDSQQLPMNFYCAYEVLREHLPRDCLIVNEGSNTMDIGRTMLPNFLPRHRLDAGTFGTMGVGVSFAVAAGIWAKHLHPGKKVICIEGDSAFGFSGMEVETILRYQLPVITIIMNNNGITRGTDAESFHATDNRTLEIMPFTLMPNARYEQISQAFGGRGEWACTPEQLRAALLRALACDVHTIINVQIDPTAERKEQEHGWLTGRL